jgi:hypothetical protein
MCGSNGVQVYEFVASLALPVAAELVSEVANAGQVLMDEPTFRLVKDSLNMLGMVTESGYDDTALQSMLQSQMMSGIQRQVGCSSCTR